MIAGLSHITFIVKDLERTAEFLETIFDAKEIFSSETAKYFLINDLWIALNKGEPLPSRTYNHVAFAVKANDLDELTKPIQSVGGEIVTSRPRTERCGQSIYFYDYDNHLFEVTTGTLAERL